MTITMGRPIPEIVKTRARRIINNDVARGKIIKPKICPLCNKAKPRHQIQAHHHNGYDDPRDFIWLCSACHHEEHRT